MADVLTDADIAAHDSAPGALSDADIARFDQAPSGGMLSHAASSLWDNIKGAADLATGHGAITQAVESAKSGDWGTAADKFLQFASGPAGRITAGLRDTAIEAAGKIAQGDYKGAALHLGSAILPHLEQAAGDAHSGNIGGAAGDLAGDVVTALAAKGADAIPAEALAKGAGMVGRVATDPAVLRAAVKVIPKGREILDVGKAVKDAAGATDTQAPRQASQAPPDLPAQQAPTPVARPAAPAAPPEYDALADKLRPGSTFQDLPAADQKIVTAEYSKQARERLRGKPAPAADPAPAPAPAPASAPTPAPPTIADRATAGAQQLRAAATPSATLTAPSAPATPYDETAQNLADTYKANAAKADEVKAQWMFDRGITSDQLKPGQTFKDLVDQIPNPNAKSGKFTTRLNDADHPARVKAVADLLDAKHAQAQAAAGAAKLNAAGISADAAGRMTQTQLQKAIGASSPPSGAQAAETVFQLQKLEIAAKGGAAASQ